MRKLNGAVRACKKCGTMFAERSCKACALAYRMANREKIKAVQDAYRSTNIEKVRAQDRARYAKNPEAFRLSAAKWEAKNKDRITESRKKWREENSAKRKIQAAEYSKGRKEINRIHAAKSRARNPEAYRERNKKWIKENPFLVRAMKQNRRAREVAANGKLSSRVVDRLLKLQRGICVVCSTPLGDDVTIDHIMPLALGGGNQDNNIQLLHRKCNSAKHAKHPIDFMQSRGFLL